jgi:uncharacterized protein with beta-barrel porin domain
MKQGRLRGTLLATSSALALMVGAEGAAQAQCAFNNVNGAITNTTTNNCISFNNGGTFSGPVTNASSGTLNASGGTPNQPNPGTATGISVVGGSHLTGAITNQGSITTSFRGINVGGGQYGAPGGFVTGSITNNGSITANRGIELSASSTLTGDVVNNGTINYTDTGINVNATAVTAGTITGSIINAGTLSGIGGGIGVQHYTVTGSITNTVNGTITSTAGFAGMELSFGSVLGSLTNDGTITIHGTNHDGLGMFVDRAFVGGSFSNTGTINGDFGIAVSGDTATPATIVGNVVNSGTINANSGTVNAGRPGIEIAGATIGGSITNTASGHINAAGGIGIYVTSSTSPGGASIGGSIVNQGSISAKTGIAVGGLSTVAGGITNSGTLTGTGGTAIDLVTNFGGSGAPITINQQAGTITGDILLSSLGDTVNITGGAVAGNITGTGASGTVDFALGGSTFSYSNAISGVAAVNVNSGTLFDNSSIAATLISINGGTLAPGQSGTPGTLSVTGSLVFASAATYMITINGANAAKTAVTGTAALGGASVKVANGSTVNFGQTYTILTTTGTVSGKFNPVVTFGSLTGTLTYDAHDVFLTFGGAGNKITALLPPGSPQNVLNVAGALDNFLASGATPPASLLNLFGFTPQQLVSALTQLSGEAGTGAQQSGFQLMSSFLALLTGPQGGGDGGPAMPFAPERAQTFPSDVALAYASVLKAPPKYVPHWTTWAAAFGGSNNTDGDPTGVGSHDLTARAGAVAAGMDYHLSPDTIVGLSLAGGGTSWGLSAGLGGGRSDAFLAGLYGSQRWGQSYLSGALSYTSYWMSTNRTITVAGPDTLNASFNAQNFGGRLEGGFLAWSAPLRVIPYAAVQAQSFHSPGYSESSSLGAPDPFALSYAAQTATVVRAELGSRFDQLLAQANGASIDLFGRLAWAHDWQSNPNLTATFIGLPAATFVVNGAAPPTDLALVTAGAEWRARSGWALMGKFDGEFAQRSQTYVGTAKLSYKW